MRFACLRPIEPVFAAAHVAQTETRAAVVASTAPRFTCKLNRLYGESRQLLSNATFRERAAA